MARFNEQVGSLSKEELDSLGKTSSRISKAGAHLVKIKSALEINDQYIKIEFEDKAGLTAEYTGFLDSTKDGVTSDNIYTQNTMTFIAKACGFDNAAKACAKTKQTTVTFKSGEKDAESFTSLVGKELYILTTSEIEADDKDPKKTYVKQKVNEKKFFDKLKRNSIEIASDADEGLTLDDEDAEAKTVVEILYKHTANQAAQTKLIQLQ
ncbi:MAG: hypothetical protein U9Q40_05900, partial [Campylobacterota bacterium]|nr:hypothetical protein [Campylobacterota bacterium]